MLLVVLLLVSLPIVYIGWRQNRQKDAIAALKARGAILRLEPFAVPFLEQVAGKDFSQQIIEVYWVNGDVSDEDLALVSGVTTLRKLELTSSKLDASALRHISGMSDLYTLHLSGTNVGDEALEHVSKLPNLGILSLNQTKVTDNGLKQLQNLVKLERLLLDGTAVTDAGLAHLAKMAQLKELSLQHLPVTDQGLLKLAGLKNLSILKLAYNPNVTAEGIVDLKRALPHLHVTLPDEQGPENPATRSRNPTKKRKGAKKKD